MRVLTLAELNRATLARQLLLQRRRQPVTRALERVAGLQAQWPPAPYVGLWSRLEGFRRESLERAVLRGEVVKATVMRSTIHLVSRQDYPAFWTALHDIPWGDGSALADGRRLAGQLRKLAQTGNVTMSEVLAYLAERHGLRDLHARRVWHVARVRAHIHHAPETALWSTRPQAIYAALDKPSEVDPLAAVVYVVRRYLAAFGPATRADIAEWSGMRVGDFAAALDALEPLRRFRSEEGRELLDLPRAPLPEATTPAPVRLLPKWDSILLAHADRRRVLPEDYRKAVVIKNGDVAQTFLVDGLVAGTWSSEGSRIRIKSFAPLPRRVRREVEDEAERLAAWLPNTPVR
jgi:hypothetical protein